MIARRLLEAASRAVTIFDATYLHRAGEVRDILSELPAIDSFHPGLVLEIDYSLERAKVPKELLEQRKLLQGSYRMIVFQLLNQNEMTHPVVLAAFDPSKSVEDVLRIHRETVGSEMSEEDYRTLVARKTGKQELINKPSAYQEIQTQILPNDQPPLQSHTMQNHPSENILKELADIQTGKRPPQEPAPENRDLAPPDSDDDDRHNF